MTPEGARKLKVKKWLTEIGAYWFMPVQTGYGKKALDFMGCYFGEFFAIETKGREDDYRPHQKVIADEITAAGGVVFLVLDDTSLALAKAHLKMVAGICPDCGERLSSQYHKPACSWNNNVARS